MPQNDGAPWRKNPCPSTKINGLSQTLMALEPQLLWQTNADFYAIRADFIGMGMVFNILSMSIENPVSLGDQFFTTTGAGA